jgi:chromosome segregation ATPase
MLNVSERDLNRIFSIADAELLSGKAPHAERIATETGLSPSDVEAALDQWWQSLNGRVQLGGRGGSLPEMPESMAQSFMRIWQQALQEAQASIHLHRQQHEVGEEESRRISEEALRQSQQVQQELEARYREQGGRLEEARQLAKSLEAEITVLKNNLAGETAERKQEEQKRANLEHEMSQLRKQFDDYRRTAEQRFKDEQRKSVDAAAKAEVEVRHYRSMLDKVRDEAGRKEAALTREVHDLQGQLARRDVRIDTQNSQIKALEEELAAIKQDVGTQHRDLTKINSNLLSERNKNKRLEDRIKELQDEVQRLNQRSMTASADATRRENALRAQLKEKEDAVLKAQARCNALEKRLVAQDEEIRRLSARL